MMMMIDMGLVFDQQNVGCKGDEEWVFKFWFVIGQWVVIVEMYYFVVCVVQYCVVCGCVLFYCLVQMWVKIGFFGCDQIEFQ